MKITLDSPNHENEKIIHTRILDIFYDNERDKPVFVCMYKNEINILEIHNNNLTQINIDEEDIKFI